MGEYTYPARLTENYKAYMGEGTKRRLVWFQEFQRLDQVWPDGNPVFRYNQPVLAWGDGTPAAKGSDADVIAEAFFEIAGCDLLPDTPGSEEYVGVVFRLKDVKKEGTEKVYLRIPVEHMPGYKHPTPPVTIGTQETQSEPATVDDTESAFRLAALLDGEDATEVLEGKLFKQVVNDPTMEGVKSVLGISLRGGMLRGALLTKLTNEGFVTVDEDGLITAVASG